MASQRLSASPIGRVRQGEDQYLPAARFGAATGLVAFSLAIGALVIGAPTGTVAANPGATAQEVARAYGTTATPLVWIGASVQVLAFLFLFAFLTYLAMLATKSAGTGLDWLASTAMGSGQAFVAVTVAGFAIGGVARFRAGPGLDLSAAMALFDIHVGLYVASWALAAVFLGAIAGLSIRSGALPRWLSLTAGLISIVSLTAVALPLTPLAGLPRMLIWFWTLAASVTLLRQRVPAPLLQGPLT